MQSRSANFGHGPNGHRQNSQKNVGTEWAQRGHKTKKAHRSEPLLSWNPTYLLVAEARFELTTFGL